MNILYVSSLCSEPMMQSLFATANEKPHPAPQKFHSLLVAGFIKNGHKVTCLVAPPVTLRSHPKIKWWGRKIEDIGGVRYVYIPFYNHPVPKLLGFRIYSFIYTLIWVIKTRGEKAMVCDVLYEHALASMRACRLAHTKCAGIITDIPGMLVGSKNDSWFRRWLIKNRINAIKHFTHFVPLTEAMNDIFNPTRRRPYVVVEGLVDSSMEDKKPTPYQDNKRHITYTGTLDARYGVKTMIKAFMMLPHDDIILDIYGKGSMDQEMRNYVQEDSRIHFHGMVPVEEAVLAQRSSYLLLNPRPSKEDFTKYSFPSKNMEYMATGVALLTAKLPGMPVEYYHNVFLFEEESVMGLFARLNEILKMSNAEIKAMGLQGKNFVMRNKNNIKQANMIIDLLKR